MSIEQWKNELVEEDLNEKTKEKKRINIDSLLKTSVIISAINPLFAPVALLLLAIKHYKKNKKNDKYQSFKDEQINVDDTGLVI